MRRLVGDALTGPPRSTTCLYTLTADRDFVLDRLPDHPQVLVALGAAHGFKFASWFGRTLASSSSTADRRRHLAVLTHPPRRCRDTGLVTVAAAGSVTQPPTGR